MHSAEEIGAALAEWMVDLSGTEAAAAMYAKSQGAAQK